MEVLKSFNSFIKVSLPGVKNIVLQIHIWHPLRIHVLMTPYVAFVKLVLISRASAR